MPLSMVQAEENTSNYIPITFETDGTFSTPDINGCEFGKEIIIPISGYDAAYLNDDFTNNILSNGYIKFTCTNRNNIKLAYYGINPLWYIASSNLLSTSQQTYVCNNYNYLNSFDTIWYFTDSKALIFGNYINTDSSGYAAFSNCYVLENDGTLIAQSNPRKWRDNSNLGAVYKSSGAFNITTNKMSLLQAPCPVYYSVTLKANPTSGGTVTGGGSYEKGKTATIKATANNGYKFTSWSDGNTSSSRTITVNSNITLTANFTQLFTITLSASPTSGGTVTGGGTFDNGTNVTITATPNTDYRFTSWSDGNTLNPRVITANSNLNLTANFVSTVISPSVDLPTPNEPNITTNTEQSSYISSISSPVVSGGVINYFRYDYFNIYAVNSTAIKQEIGYGNEELLIKYKQDNSGRYLIPVYDHSEVVIYGPNITISTSGLQITPSLYSGVSYSYPNSNGIIQRDVSRFDYTYVDLQMLNQYSYEDIPFSNSNTNTGKIEYLGQQLSVRSGGTGSRSIMLEFNGQNYSTTFYIVITDSFKDIEQAKQEQNQTTINTNVNNNFTNLDNQLKDMANTNDNGQFTQLGNELITNVESKATSLFYPITWAIDTLDDMANVEEKAVIALPALFKTNESYNIDFSVVENELPQLFTFIRSIIWIALAMLCINGVQNIIGGGNNDN